MRLVYAIAIVLLGCGGSKGGGTTTDTDAASASGSTGDSSSGSSGSGSGSGSASGSSSTGPEGCAENEMLCDDVCIDVESDPLNCGACGNEVPPDVDCVEGEPGCVLEGLAFCDGVCVDIRNDDENCGACGASCGDLNCMGNGCCHVIAVGPEPRSCADICAEAGMTCKCPMSAAAAYDGECGLGAVNDAGCDMVPDAMITCGTEKCDCILERIDCGCAP